MTLPVAAPAPIAAANVAPAPAAAVGADGGGGVDPAPAQVAPPPAAGAGGGQGAAPVVGAAAAAAAAAQPPVAVPADDLGAVVAPALDAVAGGHAQAAGALGAVAEVENHAQVAPAHAAAGGGQGAAPAPAAAVGAGGVGGVDPAQVAPPPPPPAPAAGAGGGQGAVPAPAAADAAAAPAPAAAGGVAGQQVAGGQGAVPAAADAAPDADAAAAPAAADADAAAAGHGVVGVVVGGGVDHAQVAPPPAHVDVADAAAAAVHAPAPAHAAAAGDGQGAAPAGAAPLHVVAQHGDSSPVRSGFLKSAVQGFLAASAVMGGVPPREYRVSAAAAAAASPPITAPASDYLPLPPTASSEVTSLLHFSTAEDAANGYVFIPTGSPEIPYLRINRDGSKSLADNTFEVVPRSEDAKHNQLARAAWKNIEERIYALLPRTWLNEKGSPITAKVLLNHGGKLKIYKDEQGHFQSSSVELDLPESLTLQRKEVAGKMGGATIISRIEITQSGDLSFYTARENKITLADYDKNVQKNILAQFLSVAGEVKIDAGEERRAAELSRAIEKTKALGETKALDDARTERRPPRRAFESRDDMARADTGALGGDAPPLKGGTIAALPAESKAATFKTPLPKGFQHFAGIRSGSKKVTHCESYPDGSYELFDGDSPIARSNELEKMFHRSEMQNIAAQKELQLQALEAILSCKQATRNRDLIRAAKNCLERFVVERDGEGGFKFQLPRVGANKPGSISITSAGEITLIGKPEDIRSLLREEPDVSGWPSSQRKKNKQRQSEKVEAVTRLVPAIEDLSTFSEAHIAGCRDESELLKLFFLTHGAKYLSLAKDVDKYDSNKRLIFTFGADQFVEIKLISDASIADPRQIYELTTVGSKVTLDKLIELIKAENPGIHDKTSQVEALFAARSKEIALERKGKKPFPSEGKKPFPSEENRQLKLLAIEEKYKKTFPGKKGAAESITDNKSNTIDRIEECAEPVDLLRHIGKNLFQRIKDADVDYEIKSVGWFSRHKIQNYKFHLEVPSERGRPNRSFDFVISVEESGEISNCDLKWNPESKGELQPTFENVAEAMNRMGGGSHNRIDVKKLRAKSTQLKLPSSPVMIVPLPKGFEHNPGLFARNKPCKFCAIHSDGTRTLLDENGDIVASGDKIKGQEQDKITAQFDRIAKVTDSLAGKSRASGVAVPQATQDAKILGALVEKLLGTVPVKEVKEVKKVSARGAATSSKEQGSSYRLPLPNEGWSIEISGKGAVTLKGCTLEQALKALKLRREDLLPSVGERAASAMEGSAELSADVTDGLSAHGGIRSKRSAHGGSSGMRGEEEESKERGVCGARRSVHAGEEAGGGGHNSDSKDAAVPVRRSPSPSAAQPLSGTQVTEQSRLIEKIVNIAILALPEGKEIEDLITAVRNVEKVSEALDGSYAKQFQTCCSVYSVTSSSAESKSGESGMSFEEACSGARSSDILRQLSSMTERKSDLRSLKHQALKKLSAPTERERSA